MMSETEPPTALFGDTEPTIERIAAARRQLDMHIRVCVPEPACQWCLTSWPCRDAGWAMRVVRRAQIEHGLEP